MKAYTFSLAHKSKPFTKKPWFYAIEKQKPSVYSLILSVKRKKTSVKTITTSVNGYILSVKRKISSVKTIIFSVNSFILSVKKKISIAKEKNTALAAPTPWVQL